MLPVWPKLEKKKLKPVLEQTASIGNKWTSRAQVTKNRIVLIKGLYFLRKYPRKLIEEVV